MPKMNRAAHDFDPAGMEDRCAGTAAGCRVRFRLLCCGGSVMQAAVAWRWQPPALVHSMSVEVTR